jgi:hypothetical protein
MEYIGCDGKINITVRETFPEGTEYASTNIPLQALGSKRVVAVSGCKSVLDHIDCPFLSSPFLILQHRQILGPSLALWAHPVLGTCDQTLFWVVGHIA